MYELKIKLLCSNAKLPEFANEGDAGMDVFSIEDKIIEIGESSLIRTGIAMELPKNTEIQVRPKSGLAIKNGITLLNSPGTIDEGYRGELKIILINHGREKFHVKDGMKIAQIVLKPIYRFKVKQVNDIDCETQRGECGFGSSGLL